MIWINAGPAPVRHVLAREERHIEALLRGEDYDYDPNCAECKRGKPGGQLTEWFCKNHTGRLHSALAAWNFDAITSYYKWYPQGDDRLHVMMPNLKIGLDIDEVLCDFTAGWSAFYNDIPERPTKWFYDRKMGERFKKMKEKGILDDFYSDLKPKIDPNDIHFEPHCYVTSRPVDTSITERWLDKHGFPTTKVITVPVNASKVQVIKEAGVEVFVDDRYENFEELNRNGVCCFLFDAPHNQRYDVGFKRIYSLKELHY